jgi:hypothetical protein
VLIEAALLSGIEVYLDRLAARFPGAIKRKAGDSDAPIAGKRDHRCSSAATLNHTAERLYVTAIAPAEKHHGTGAVEIATLLNDLAVVF